MGQRCYVSIVSFDKLFCLGDRQKSKDRREEIEKFQRVCVLSCGKWISDGLEGSRRVYIMASQCLEGYPLVSIELYIIWSGTLLYRSGTFLDLELF